MIERMANEIAGIMKSLEDMVQTNEPLDAELHIEIHDDGQCRCRIVGSTAMIMVALGDLIDRVSENIEDLNPLHTAILAETLNGFLKSEEMKDRDDGELKIHFRNEGGAEQDG